MFIAKVDDGRIMVHVDDVTGERILLFTSATTANDFVEFWSDEDCPHDNVDGCIKEMELSKKDVMEFSA